MKLVVMILKFVKYMQKVIFFLNQNRLNAFKTFIILLSFSDVFSLSIDRFLIKTYWYDCQLIKVFFSNKTRNNLII